ncbi:unnamed protein product (macronuclear) [Paramecium tetraurelia]|uniref:Uncharacterized protein n=1 Tax=Paramecium tetraurelia TaxID=5888 RepID=A0E123_PARTE|nr:uncharacterized protein GSPATT00022159001 [Paramecium tetraurelia]CAK88990.1 unnamed protein product [Paramecium tetraurelia]|eukprot:XP_001456387.1 hypothetical protein (macronuclear) [Paramecium tetraurelia strain d4-2]
MLKQQPQSAKSGNAIKQKKETLERFAYCNSQQLFQNNIFDLRQFIKQNYEKYCELLERVESTKLVVKSKKEILEQLRNKFEQKSNKPRANLCVLDELSQLKRQIEIKQSANNELKSQLEQMNQWTKKQDFFQEYQEICKQVDDLRIQNDQLLKA